MEWACAGLQIRRRREARASLDLEHVRLSRSGGGAASPAERCRPATAKSPSPFGAASQVHLMSAVSFVNKDSVVPGRRVDASIAARPCRRESGSSSLPVAVLTV
jgi:hypothetical protein